MLFLSNSEDLLDCRDFLRLIFSGKHLTRGSRYCCSIDIQKTVHSDPTREVNGGVWPETTLPTIMGHPGREALVETTILAFIPILFLNLTAPITFVIDQL